MKNKNKDLDYEKAIVGLEEMNKTIKNIIRMLKKKLAKEDAGAERKEKKYKETEK
ncbi:hypothetical protein ES705_11372 [subsurface metagenome]